LIHDIPTCQDLVQRIEREAIESLNKTRSLLQDEVPHGQIAGKQIQDPQADVTDDRGSVAKNVNNPEAQIWGVGKSKL